ncbi:MAG: RmlC-like cupin domain-containing protein [Benjaminiella poitrasii]|nr:MAG: RmlC-like cupin domain-containing protein [Benjaminiella poitrasii]
MLTAEPSSCDFLKKYDGIHAEPLWTVMEAMVPPHPNPKSVPHIWEYEKIRPALLEAGKEVGEYEAERRVLMLINPTMKAPYTTDTLYAGLQLINPGETAPAHRHRAFALRFIIEGQRGFTAVEGEKIYMEKGDVILTPPWTWHDHGHEGDDVMIWLDGLDLPIFQNIPVNFAESFEDRRYPSKEAENSALKFPWAPIQEALDSSDAEYATTIYRKPNGEPLSYIVGAEAERVNADKSSQTRRETCSRVVHIYAGQGQTEIVDMKGAKTVLKWKTNDTFAIPSWSWVTHHAASNGTAYLFSFNDKPLLENLKMYKAEYK